MYADGFSMKTYLIHRHLRQASNRVGRRCDIAFPLPSYIVTKITIVKKKRKRKKILIYTQTDTNLCVVKNIKKIKPYFYVIKKPSRPVKTYPRHTHEVYNISA